LFNTKVNKERLLPPTKSLDRAIFLHMHLRFKVIVEIFLVYVNSITISLFQYLYCMWDIWFWSHKRHYKNWLKGFKWCGT